LLPDQEMTDPDPEKQADLQLEALEKWQRIKALGGPEEYFRLGGRLGLTPGYATTLKNGFDGVEDLVTQDQALKEVDAIADDQLPAMQKQAVEQELQAARN